MHPATSPSIRQADFLEPSDDLGSVGDGVDPNEGGYSLLAEAIEKCPARWDWLSKSPG